ncbi:MAG: M23 family metallopeptidase, partial [Thermodesulfovibrionales bacterium]|nr:M23 family metallopeptidase [Thermodesulfovibrionales bacterium]
MHRMRFLLKKAFTPITIMVIPHSSRKPFNLKIPSIGIFISILLWLIGTGYVFSIAIDTLEYYRMQDKVQYYSGQFMEMKTTMSALQKAEAEFRKLFSLKSKEKILENVDTSDSGSIDMEALKQQIKKTVEDVGEIKDYLSQQRDLFMATPKGWPLTGNVTSSYGKRKHPKSGEEDFHNGIDVSAPPGNPVTVTADGIVSFSGWNGGSGNLVVVEHGFGYSTFYAHSKMNAVKVGQRVKKGDVIAYVGSTGNTTGPHLHYEVWKNGSPVNPKSFI